MAANSSFLLELELKEYLDMTTSKSHIISEVMTRVLFVQGAIKDCFLEDSGCFADALSSVALLFLKNDWELTLGKHS